MNKGITLAFPYMIAAASFMILAAVSEAETLTGTVVDAGSGAPLVSAAVRIDELSTGVMTGADGAFSFPEIPAGTYTLRVSRPGYAAASLPVTLPVDAPLVVRLTVSPFGTDDIIVTARGRRTLPEDIPGSVAVVTDEDFHEANPVSLPDALAARPGISVSSEMPWSERAVIRGLTRDQVVLLVDGARVVTATATAAQFGTIAHGDIERVEVLKGPISVLYGSGSTGGVVNVITRSGGFSPEPRWDVTVNPSYESAANGLTSYERAAWSGSRLYVGVSQSNRRYTDYRASDGLRVPNSQFEDRQVQVTAGMKIGDGSLLEVRHQRFEVLDAGLPGASSFPENALASYPATTRTLTDAAWTWRPAAGWWRESRMNAYYQPMERQVRLLPRIVQTMEGKPDPTKTTRVTALAFYPEADHFVSGARWQNELAFGAHRVVAGIEGWQKHMTSDRTKLMQTDVLDSATGDVLSSSTRIIGETPVPESRQRPVGIFAEDTFPLGGRMEITLGGRIDRIHTENDPAYLTYQPPSDELLWEAHRDDDSSWSMVAGAIFHASDAVDINIAAARSFRSPTIEERYLYAELGKLTVGDPNLDPEHGVFVEGGVSATLGSTRLTGQMFVNNLIDMVILRPGTFNGQDADVYANAGRARLRGGEATADWAASPSLLVSGDISYVRGTDEEQGADLPAMPPLTAHTAVRWSFARRWWIEPTLTMVADQNRVAPGESATAGYGRLDIAAGSSALRTGSVVHDVVIGMKNVTDRRYEDHLTVSRGYKMYGMGRSIYVSWNMRMIDNFGDE